MRRRALIAGASAALLAGPALAFTSDRIVVEARGRGPDIVFIPGLGSSEDVWRGEAARLATLYRIHLVRVLGFQAGPTGANATGPLSRPVATELVCGARSWSATRSAARSP